MRWRITNMNAGDNYVVAEAIGHEEYIYRGFIKDYQPHGLGALYNDGLFVKCGEWVNGELPAENILSKVEYDKIMNGIFNK